jgi:hypothetical protein
MMGLVDAFQHSVSLNHPFVRSYGGASSHGEKESEPAQAFAKALARRAQGG